VERYLPAFSQDPNGQANCWLVAQAPGQKGAIIRSSSEPRRVDTKRLTTAGRLRVWVMRQGIGLSRRGDLGLAPPGYDVPLLRGLRDESQRDHPFSGTRDTRAAPFAARKVLQNAVIAASK